MIKDPTWGRMPFLSLNPLSGYVMQLLPVNADSGLAPTISVLAIECAYRQLASKPSSFSVRKAWNLSALTCDWGRFRIL